MARYSTLAAMVLTCLTSATEPALAVFAATDCYLPSVGRGPGRAGSQWYSTVWVYNPSAAPVNVQFSFLERDRENLSPPVYNVTIPAGDVQRFDNAVYTMFGVERFGALRAVASDRVVINGRIFSQPAAGEAASVGQFFGAVPSSFAVGVGEKTQLLGVYQTAPEAESPYRYNYGFVEVTGAVAQVRTTAFDPTGIVLASDTVTLRGREVKQFNVKDRLLTTPNVVNVRLEVEVLSGTGKVVAFGSGLANQSNDPSTFEMSFPDGQLGGGVAGVTAGAGLVGGGTSGTVILNVGAGTNIVAGEDSVSLAPNVTLQSLRTTGIGGSTQVYLRPNPGDAGKGYVSVHDGAGIERASLYVRSTTGAGRVDTQGPNGNSNVLLTTNEENADLGFISVYDDAGGRRVGAYASSGSRAGVVETLGPNGTANVRLSNNANNADLGYVSIRNDAGNARVVAYVHSSSFAGRVETSGPNGSLNTVLGSVSGDPNRGWIGIYDANGQIVGSLSAVQGGTLFAAGSKSVTEYPGQAGSHIVYNRLAGDEEGLYHRGRVRLESGRATIALPEHFAALADLATLTVQLTPHSLSSRGVAVAAVGGTAVSIGELAGGDGTYDVSYIVHATRRGAADEPVVLSEEGFLTRFGHAAPGTRSRAWAVEVRAAETEAPPEQPDDGPTR